MTNQEWIDMFRVIPTEQHNQMVLVLQNGSEIAIDTLFRFEPNFLVLRGRVAGSTDEGRGFFIPYNQMLYYRIERVIKLEELESIFSNPSAPDKSITPAPNPVSITSSPAAAAITELNSTRSTLLERIRAARATQ